MSLALITSHLRTGMRKKKGNSRNKSAKEHEHTLSQVTKCLSWILGLERVWSLKMCLGVNALALVLNVISEKLGCQRLWWLGVFIAPNHFGSCWEAAGDGRTGQSGVPPDKHCSLFGVLPCHPTVRVRSWVDRWSFVFLRHRTVWCHTGQSGGLILRCSDFCVALCYTVALCRVDRCR
jgi:hypothetical protein